MAGAVARFYNNAQQGTPLAAATTVVLNSTDLNQVTGSISMTNSVITLQPGTYLLTGSIGAATGTSGGRTSYGFYDVTNSAWLDQGGQAFATGSTGTNVGAGNQANALVVITAPTDVALRIAAVAGTVSTISAQGAFPAAAPNLGRAWVTIIKF